MFEREGGGGAGVWVRGWALGWKASSSRKARNRKKRGNNSRKRERQFSGTKAWDGAVKHQTRRVHSCEGFQAWCFRRLISFSLSPSEQHIVRGLSMTSILFEAPRGRGGQQKGADFLHKRHLTFSSHPLQTTGWVGVGTTLCCLVVQGCKRRLFGRQKYQKDLSHC